MSKSEFCTPGASLFPGVEARAWLSEVTVWRPMAAASSKADANWPAQKSYWGRTPSLRTRLGPVVVTAMPRGGSAASWSSKLDTSPYGTAST